MRACKAEFGYPPTTPPIFTGGESLTTLSRFRLRGRAFFFQGCRRYHLGKRCTYRSSGWLLSDVCTHRCRLPELEGSMISGLGKIASLVCYRCRNHFRSSLQVSTGGGLLLLHRLGCRHLMMVVFFHPGTLQKFVFSLRHKFYDACPTRTCFQEIAGFTGQ